ncbi:respiratory nitrate reductase subunit gamma [Solemya pervernicosa gill symbiont]|uniref:nitrate reductase (quinone) n=2 Tax=Gammaproteobacteria incertae sedis TaxID=118884 RepID=A0A1T2L746_9GAMM|nr:respiratory nitrate reductase subunit gamma [Candidatus Reidiella endopervernicosa]OOZ40766.1 respiratory nitrate reductase subunit gamma [Solemya pervernicosa gill symbiont]QKQ26400.1 respiratory nitrate reductase subunit gamma [Candidatus Reidiella endopervernicosa]
MTLHDFIFGAYPYLAGTIFLLGNWIRYDREQYTWKTDSSQLLSNKGMRVASNLFHVGIIAIFFGHMVGLLTPHSWFLAMGVSDVAHQYVAIYAGLIFGSMCFVGALMLFLRRLTNERVKAAGRTRDTFIIGWLLVTVIVGLSTTIVSYGHASHGNADVMIALTQWVQSVATLQVDPSLLAGVEPVFKLHIFLGMTVFLLFPFTRLVHVWSVPIGYLGRAYQVVRRKHVSNN